MSNRNRSIGTPIETGIDILLKLNELGGKATILDLGTSTNRIKYLARAHGVVKPVVKSGKPVTRKHTDENGNARRGRPATVWTLTDKGRKRVKRRLAAS